ncbi:cytochrome C biogenesis protein transmembrane region [Mobiluncus mulieris ATCC 35239]|uniref:Cytochrome C biogenesis protein transmembrane region n=2 Tax=Mobiluncus mulieris TaxID=2052 RepID=E0QNU9_9ACTO|nr:cytochrome c biogenesis protein CcdA [Mobiluncus mulieris]EFM46845.1 cytochrome C biogenesis protein transmembrane region [Mobiluncus mulieris ATCC 35239]MCU9970734.1 cytochrome c biogenesis protein CcdA [Mobiluncus mulieris]MCU9993605.1 cytochrome c biogenesis protein CcdA [Mobiluncus mulieris]MCV0013109.1 cytochrome c biogenesis protein CcdA [Mobiluncus mulieris]NMW80960.1 cytochrome c biogenesis protein CcdA [Mobiluncus mulieris]
MDALPLAVAYAGGVLTLFSPCSALLIPSFFAYAFASRRTLLSRILVFFVGLLAGLLPLGVALGAIGAQLAASRATITLWCGIAVIIFGLWQALALPAPSWQEIAYALEPEKRRAARAARQHAPRDKTSPLAVFLLGLAYGLASTGCAGHITGAISVYVVSGGSPIVGFFIMLCFAAGMYTPVAILAFFWDRIPKNLVRPRPITVFGRPTTRGSVISGIVLMFLGVIMIFFGGGALSISVLSVEQQVALEVGATHLLSGVPNWLFVALVVLLIALLVVYLRGRRNQR